MSGPSSLLQFDSSFQFDKTKYKHWQFVFIFWPSLILFFSKNVSQNWLLSRDQ